MHLLVCVLHTYNIASLCSTEKKHSVRFRQTCKMCDQDEQLEKKLNCDDYYTQWQCLYRLNQNSESLVNNNCIESFEGLEDTQIPEEKNGNEATVLAPTGPLYSASIDFGEEYAQWFFDGYNNPVCVGVNDFSGTNQENDGDIVIENIGSVEQQPVPSAQWQEKNKATVLAPTEPPYCASVDFD